MRRCGGRLVHGSFPNESASQGRLSLVVHMIVDGTTFGADSRSLLLNSSRYYPVSGKVHLAR